MTSIGIIGSQGRMGVALAAAISEAGQRSCGIDKGGNVAKLAASADVLVDFSSPVALFQPRRADDDRPGGRDAGVERRFERRG